MVRVVLVQPPHRDTFGYSMPPLGPLHLAASARRRGHQPLFLDLALLVRRGELPADEHLIARCVQRIAAARPEAVGFTAMVSSLPCVLQLATTLRAHLPDVPLILGGQGPEQMEEALIARHAAVDAVAAGEADRSFPDWLDALSRGDDPAQVPGLVLRHHGAPLRTPERPLMTPLDAVDPPAWDLAESPRTYARAAGGGEALFPIDLGRGCSYACSFCTTPLFWGRSVRQLSPARAADEFDRLAALDGIDCVYVTHDLFTAARENVLAICAEKCARGNRLPWECRTRLDLVDDELLESLRAAGCRRILYGVESDRPGVLARVNKGGRAAQLDVRAMLASASRAGMASIVGVMAGVPGETADDVEANLQLMAEVAVIDGTSLSLHWFNVLPGNGQAAAVADRLRLEPGLHADLVRGHDLPAGVVPPEQQRMIAQDPELFAAFRVFAPDWADAAAAFLLTRNAHLLLEVLPRSLRALAHVQAAAAGPCPDPAGSPPPGASRPAGPPLPPAPLSGGPVRGVRPGTLLGTLLTFLRLAWDRPDAVMTGLLETERAEHGEPWCEARVLERGAAVRLAAGWAVSHGDARVNTLVAYERALFETGRSRLLRFPSDPLPLVRAMDSGHWPPDDAGDAPRPVLFVRHGERVTAHSLSDYLADVWAGLDEQSLVARHTGADRDLLLEARRMLARLDTPAGD